VDLVTDDSDGECGGYDCCARRGVVVVEWSPLRAELDEGRPLRCFVRRGTVPTRRNCDGDDKADWLCGVLQPLPEAQLLLPVRVELDRAEERPDVTPLSPLAI